MSFSFKKSISNELFRSDIIDLIMYQELQKDCLLFNQKQ